MKKSPPHQKIKPSYSGPSRLFWFFFASLSVAGFYALSRWAHPDVVFGALLLFGAACAMGFPVWFSFRKGESALVIEVLATLVVLAICFALCFALLFGPHRIKASKQQVPQHQLKVED